MNRFVYSIFLLLMLSGVSAAVDISLPATINGSPGAFIQVPATTNGSTVKWVVMDAGLNLFPVNLLKDTKTVVVTSLVSGSFRLLAYTSDATGPSDPAITTVVVGAPPAPPTPPTPTDPFVAALQTAYSADTDTNKATEKSELQELFKQIDVTSTKYNAAQDIMIAMNQVRSALMGNALSAERTVIANQVNADLKLNSTAALTQDQRILIRTEFDKVVTALGVVK